MDSGGILDVVSRGDADALRTLIASGGADALNPERVVDSHKRNALHIAAQIGNDEIASILLTQGSFPVDQPDKKMKTALHHASQGGHERVARVLLDHGANANATNIGGQTALHYASFGGYASLVRLLHERGAELDLSNGVGQTALHYACQSGHTDVASYLCDHRVNVNRLSSDHSLPIHFAVAYRHQALVDMLLHRPIVVPSSVLDLDTSEEIIEMLNAFTSSEGISSKPSSCKPTSAKKKTRKKPGLSIGVPSSSAKASAPAVLETPITPLKTPSEHPDFKGFGARE